MSLGVQIGLLLLAALLCGLVTGALSGRAGGEPPRRGALGRLVRLALILVPIAAGLGLPALGLVAGRPALWLEGAAALFAAYLVGCAAGCPGRRAR